MPKIYFHVDVNSAFLSWSALKALQGGSTVDLRTIPAVVGGDEAKRHGVVLAKSTLAKKFGIQTGESLFAAREFMWDAVRRLLFFFQHRAGHTVENVSSLPGMDV